MVYVEFVIPIFRKNDVNFMINPVSPKPNYGEFSDTFQGPTMSETTAENSTKTTPKIQHEN